MPEKRKYLNFSGILVMANIKSAFQNIVIPSEGVYSNDYGDTGGVTVWGITANYDPDWEGWKLVDKYRKLPNFPNNLDNPEILNSAIIYYKKKYWDGMRLDQVNSQSVAQELFDIGINQGIGIASKFIQRVVNVLNKQGTLWPDIAVDGKIGPQTISTINKAPEDSVVIALNALQGNRYIEICESNPKNEKFFNGWIKRSKS